MVMAAPAMNPTMAAWDKNSMINPSLQQSTISLYGSHSPEESERCLGDPSEERCSEGQPGVLFLILLGIKLILEESAKQQRNDGHWTNGYIPGTSHHRVYQRRYEAAV
ncbi:Os03g0195900 [Oryza sativa Japonica Group]|uniref:Os03g0195900 protein n=1 Tax=Oryza sativa subsp. japonica TaxID=39947 RepID=Q0DUB4_ORYSJ|nr:Os03g0195900 [Oryza sativa Japonica Group]|eukprot:NP_001049260.1 Os03g0195900 [Oryza sativa Japonica Group]